jgi:hypothetical protein
MKKKPKKRAAARPASKPAVDLRPHYDFRGGVRGKYAARAKQGSNVVVLDDDVAAAFKDADAVNHALRTLLEIVPPPRAGRSRTA